MPRNRHPYCDPRFMGCFTSNASVPGGVPFFLKQWAASNRRLAPLSPVDRSAGGLPKPPPQLFEVPESDERQQRAL